MKDLIATKIHPKFVGMDKDVFLKVIHKILEDDPLSFGVSDDQSMVFYKDKLLIGGKIRHHSLDREFISPEENRTPLTDIKELEELSARVILLVTIAKNKKRSAEIKDKLDRDLAYTLLHGEPVEDQPQNKTRKSFWGSLFGTKEEQERKADYATKREKSDKLFTELGTYWLVNLFIEKVKEHPYKLTKKEVWVGWKYWNYYFDGALLQGFDKEKNIICSSISLSVIRELEGWILEEKQKQEHLTKWGGIE